MGRDAMHYAAAVGDLAQVQLALASGADPSLPDDAGWTPLHFAAQGQHSAVVEALLAAGAEVDAVDGHGNTALFRAVFNYRGDPAALQALLAAGADVRRENTHGVSPLALSGRIANYDVARHLPAS